MLNDLQKKYSNIISDFDDSLDGKISLEKDLKSVQFPEEKIKNFKFSNLMLLSETDSENRLKREILNETKYAQPAILLHSYLNYRKFMEEEIPDKNLSNIENSKNIFYFGPSLGEIIALVTAGSLDLYTAGILLYNRGKYMQESCPKGTGSMLNIVGDVNKTTEKYFEFIKGYSRTNKEGTTNDINISSIMSKRLIIISGKNDAIEECAKFMKNNAIACRKLVVSAAFHSSMMNDGSAKFKEFLYNDTNNIKFIFPMVNVLSTINPEFIYYKKELQNINENDFDITVKNLLVEQFTKRVDILGCIEKYLSETVKNQDRSQCNLYDIIKRKYVDLEEFI